MSREHSSDYEDDTLLEPIIRTSRDLDSRIQNVHEAIEQLRTVAKPYSDLSDNLKIVAQTEERHRGTIGQLRAQNESLRTEIDKLNDSLQRITEEKRRLVEELNSERLEKGLLNSQTANLVSEREVLEKAQREARQQIAELREKERKLHDELSDVHKEIRARDNRIGDLELQIRNETEEHQLLLEQRIRDMTRKMEDQRAAVERQYMEKLHAKIEEFESEKREMKHTFEKALKQAEHETKKLETERNLCYSKYKNLESGLEEKKRQINSRVQRLLSEKWREAIQAFNQNQAVENSQGTSTNYMIRRPEHIARNFLNELGSTPSESSMSPGAESEEVNTNNENAPPGGRNPQTRKRSAGSGQFSRQPLNSNVATKAGNTRTNTQPFRTGSNNDKKTHKK
ncbi:hypothetical protein DdX_01050 [Ditylenchus destructor]|uniref:Uncharacterized protein n=1 Tax=Ditylenchus destructor TaxID=166010 RepID=A0AAD4NES2_9BILA|nr:hypothetical protein DdX_01050 [Ditylenchus destructor]